MKRVLLLLSLLICPVAYAGHNVTGTLYVSGNTGLGTTSPSHRLMINGNMWLPTSDTETGVIYKGVNSFVHDYPGDGYDNLFIGQSAGNFTGNTQAQVGIGFEALKSITFASYNTAVGHEAMENTTEGSNNVAIGRQSLFTNTEGYENTAVGHSSMYHNTFGVENTAAGYDSLAGNTVGSNNVAIGYVALQDNESGDLNVAVGSSALTSNDDGISNIAIGGQALNNNTSGQVNVAIGQSSMFTNTVGIENTAIGTSSLFNTTGSTNTAIGFESGERNTSGTKNVFVGYKSGESTGTVQTLTNSGCIGYQCNVKADNAFVLGGTGANSWNVGIGTTDPQKMFQVNGALQSTDLYSGDGTQGITASCGGISITALTIKDGLITSCTGT